MAIKQRLLEKKSGSIIWTKTACIDYAVARFCSLVRVESVESSQTKIATFLFPGHPFIRRYLQNQWVD
jgi:hypothetical protein